MPSSSTQLTALRRVTRRDDLESGFTLLEVLVAMAVLAIATMTLTGMRTTSVMAAAEARNGRIAREIATRVLSEIEAGVLRAYELRGQRQTVEGMEDFEWKLVIGDAEIQEAETEIHESAASSGSEDDQRRLERQQWLNRRSEIERARSENKELDELDNDELEVDDSPDEDTIEEIAVFVYWTKMISKNEDDTQGVFRLRGQASTLSLSGLTSEQAEARSDGEDSSSDDGLK